MMFHDTATTDKPTYLRHAGFLATITYRVLRLFTGAFELPDGIWRRRLDGYDREMKPLLKKAVIEKATELRARYGFKTPDAIHLDTAMIDGADLFLTGDEALSRYAELPVEVLRS